MKINWNLSKWNTMRKWVVVTFICVKIRIINLFSCKCNVYQSTQFPHELFSHFFSQSKYKHFTYKKEINLLKCESWSNIYFIFSNKNAFEMTCIYIWQTLESIYRENDWDNRYIDRNSSCMYVCNWTLPQNKKNKRNIYYRCNKIKYFDCNMMGEMHLISVRITILNNGVIMIPHRNWIFIRIHFNIHNSLKDKCNEKIFICANVGEWE